MKSKEYLVNEVECLKYEMVRASGVTNMFDLNKVVLLSGLSKAKVLFIMQNYSLLNDKYNFRKKD